MGAPPRRSRRGRTGHLARSAAVFERTGRRVVLAAWWIVSWAVRLVAIACERGGAAAMRWLDARRPATRIAILLGALLASVVVWRGYQARDDRPVDEVEALARVIHSEIGNGPPQHRLHVAWATRNLARERRQSIIEMACSPCGPQGRGRPVSSRQRATDADRALAREVLAASCALDPTGGATHFIDPLLQDKLARAGVPGYAGNTYAVVARRWRLRYGWEPYYRLGRTLELWGPAQRLSRARRLATCSAPVTSEGSVL